MSHRQKNNALNRPQQQHGLQVQTLHQSFSGPIPPPEALARYNDILPGAAERILAMAESQHHHRQKLEAEVVSSNVSAQQRGPIFGFIIAMAAIIGGVCVFDCCGERS